MTTTATTNMAKDYAAAIVEEFESMAHAAAFIEAREYETDENGDAITLAQWMHDECDTPTSAVSNELIANVAEVLDTYPHAENAAELWSYWLDHTVALEWNGKHNGTEWIITGAEIVVTLGGPNCWLEWNGSDVFTVRCAWGSDRHTEYGISLPDLATNLESLAECLPM